MNDFTSYRSSHSEAGYGKRYNTNYSAGYYAALYREFEKPILARLFAELGRNGKSLLDFACGTGRITQLAPQFFDRVVGVDVSADMLRHAHTADPIEYVCRDVTREPLHERFDVITAFRFFLNAEPTLRREALAAIRQHLADDGRLVCNIHMNANSVMGMVYRAARFLPFVPQHNTLSYAEFEKFLQEGGFSVEQVIWYGAVPRPGRFFGGFLDRWLGPMERTLAKLGLQGRFSHSFVVVARVHE